MLGTTWSQLQNLRDWSTGGTLADVFAPGTRDDLLAAAIHKGPASPAHQAKLRKIRAETMLADFITNDEVLSGYAPEELTMAYNELSQLSPRAAMQTALIRPLLRKRLQSGALEPFELEQLVKIESELKKQERGGAG